MLGSLISYIYNNYYDTEDPTKYPTYYPSRNPTISTPCYIKNHTVINSTKDKPTKELDLIENNTSFKKETDIGIRILCIILGILFLFYCVDIPVFLFLFIALKKTHYK